VAVDASRASGGLAIAWDIQAISLYDFHANHNLIQENFHIIGTNIHGHITNVYFLQGVTNKLAMLSTIERINANRAHPLWIVGGEFNMITKLEEKSGGRVILEMESDHFRDFIQNNWLMDLPLNYGIYTWNNKRSGS